MERAVCSRYVLPFVTGTEYPPVLEEIAPYHQNKNFSQIIALSEKRPREIPEASLCRVRFYLLEPEHKVKAETAQATFQFFMGLDVADPDAIGAGIVKLEVFVEEVDKAMVVGYGKVNRADSF